MGGNQLLQYLTTSFTAADGHLSTRASEHPPTTHLSLLDLLLLFHLPLFTFANQLYFLFSFTGQVLF